MPDAKHTLDESHLLFARQANGEAWKLLEGGNLSQDEKDLVLYTVFASSYHWAIVGDVVNRQRGEWLISRAYNKLEMNESSLFHAKKCFEITHSEPAGFQDFDFAYADEALAKSHALNGATGKAQRYYDRALKSGMKISNEKDRDLFMGDLKSGNWGGFVPS